MNVRDSEPEDIDNMDAFAWQKEINRLRDGIKHQTREELMRNLNKGIENLQDEVLNNMHLVEGDRDLQIIKDAQEG